MVLHLLEQTVVDEKAFTQRHITEARKQLATALINVKSPSRLHTCEVFRKCFPLLLQVAKGSSSTPIIDCTDDQERVVSGPLPVGAVDNIKRTDGDDDEDMGNKTPKEISKDTKIKDESLSGGATDLTTQTTNIMLHTNDETKVVVAKNDDDNEFFDTLDTADNDSNIEDTAAASKAANDDSVSALSGDTTFYDIMREAKLQCFPTMEAVTPIVEAYQTRSGNYLRIKRSINDRFRVYECREHLGCRFEIRISRRRSDGLFVVSRMKNKLTDVRRPAKAKDGRKWKERRPANLNDIVVKVLKTKDGDPTPSDVIKTAANECGIILPYMTAYRVITKDVGVGRRLTAKSFEQMTPYLEAMKKCNTMSVIGCTKSQINELVDVYFFPGFMNDALQFVRPVVSLDAAHLRSEYKGTLYTVSVLSGNNDVFPIGVLISSGNEDRAT